MMNTNGPKLQELLLLAEQHRYIDGFEVREHELWIQIGSMTHAVSHDKVWMFMVGLLRETSLQQRTAPSVAA